tara:strand:+ start:582 stop:773 length:192 start_codon:yes stop_codon:yes gene_type:complete
MIPTFTNRDRDELIEKCENILSTNQKFMETHKRWLHELEFARMEAESEVATIVLKKLRGEEDE